MVKTLYKTDSKRCRNRYIHFQVSADRNAGGIGIGWKYDPDLYALHNFFEFRIGLWGILQFSMQWGKDA